MARRKSSTFTEVELEFMQIVWERGDVTTEGVQNALKARGRELSDGSIRKILSILLAKGHLERNRQGRSYIYRATVDKNQAQLTMVQDLLKRAFGGSMSLMVAALFKGRSVGETDIADVRKVIDQYASR